MLKLDSEKFAQVEDEATDKAKRSPQDARRWCNAIRKAAEILSASALWHLMDDDVLLLVSPQSDEIYEVDENLCERIDGEKRVYCPAFSIGRPCWHRAARKLLLNYASE